MPCGGQVFSSAARTCGSARDPTGAAELGTLSCATAVCVQLLWLNADCFVLVAQEVEFHATLCTQFCISSSRGHFRLLCAFHFQRRNASPCKKGRPLCSDGRWPAVPDSGRTD